jgi:hypothetical protein
MKNQYALPIYLVIALLLLGIQSTNAQRLYFNGKKVYIQAAGAYDKGLNAGYWDIPAYNPEFKKGQNIQVWAKDGGTDRIFRFYPAQGQKGYHVIIPEHGNKKYGRVDLQGNKRGNGVNIHTWTVNKSDAQLFKIEPLKNGNYKIYNKNGMAVCLAGRSYKNGSNVHTWEDHEGHWMEWVIIDAETGEAYASYIPKPKGKITVPEGYNMQDVKVYFYSKNHRQPIVKSPNADGTFSFPEANVVENDYVAVVRTEAEGLTSAAYQFHKSKKAPPLNFDLKRAPAGTQLVKTKHRGNIPYRSNGKYLINTEGNVNSDDHFFFRDLQKNTNEKQQLRKLIGVSGQEGQTDKEIYDITLKTWAFYAANTKSIFGNNGDMKETVRKAFDESGNEKWKNGPVEYWTTVEQFVQLYNKYGFMPVGNCSSAALAFAAMLRTAGVPANKMAVERMLYDHYRDHWAVIVEINDTWYWFDPTLSRESFPSYEKLTSIPSRPSPKDYEHPYEIITVPGSKLNYVPICGKDGKVEQ